MKFLGGLETTCSLKDIYLAFEVGECMLSNTSMDPSREFIGEDDYTSWFLYRRPLKYNEHAEFILIQCRITP